MYDRGFFFFFFFRLSGFPPGQNPMVQPQSEQSLSPWTRLAYYKVAQSGRAWPCLGFDPVSP